MVASISSSSLPAMQNSTPSNSAPNKDGAGVGRLNICLTANPRTRAWMRHGVLASLVRPRYYDPLVVKILVVYSASCHSSSVYGISLVCQVDCCLQVDRCHSSSLFDGTPRRCCSIGTSLSLTCPHYIPLDIIHHPWWYAVAGT